MPSPVLSSDLTPLTSTSDLCTRFSQLIGLYDLFSSFLGWLLGDDGELSDEALAGIYDRTVPIGTILMYASHTPPSDKFMTCSGQALSRTAYPALFSRLGTYWGVGDGSTTFNLPDFRDRFPVGQGASYVTGATGGEATVTLSGQNVGPHFHGVGISSSSSSSDVTLIKRPWSKTDADVTGAWGVTGDDPFGDVAAITSGDIATSEAISDGEAGTAHNNLPPYLAVPFIIKVS